LKEPARASRVDIAGDTGELTLCYEVLRRRARDLRDLRDIGVLAFGDASRSPIDVRDAIDREFHVRSIAYFEHSFHVPVES
jgi:hypothetical protein